MAEQLLGSSPALKTTACDENDAELQSMKRNERDSRFYHASTEQEASLNPPVHYKCQWGEELHKGFLAAIFDFGLNHVKPKDILKLWDTAPPGIELDQIRSHLQKYRRNANTSRKLFKSQLSSSIAESQQKNKRRAITPHLHAYPISGCKKHRLGIYLADIDDTETHDPPQLEEAVPENLKRVIKNDCSTKEESPQPMQICGLYHEVYRDCHPLQRYPEPSCPSDRHYALYHHPIHSYPQHCHPCHHHCPEPSQTDQFQMPQKMDENVSEISLCPFDQMLPRQMPEAHHGTHNNDNMSQSQSWR